MRYRLFFVEEFDYTRTDYSHSQIPREHVDRLKESISREGTKNPLLVTHYGDGKLVVHPGKSRCVAAEELGIHTLPAVVYDRGRRSSFCEGMPITVEEARSLFTGDLAVEASDRFFSVKKEPPGGG